MRPRHGRLLALLRAAAAAAALGAAGGMDTISDEILAALRPGIDGLILEAGGDAHATFLPQVWEHLPSPRDFLAHLKHKAGLPRSFWSPEVRLLRYTVEKWMEGE